MVGVRITPWVARLDIPSDAPLVVSSDVARLIGVSDTELHRSSTPTPALDAEGDEDSTALTIPYAPERPPVLEEAPTTGRKLKYPLFMAEDRSTVP